MHINDLYDLIFRLWRRRRFQWFLDAIRPTLDDSLLDVGGLPAFWIRQPPCLGRIVTVNLLPSKIDPALFPDHHITMILGDACDLPMEDNSFDIVFSNSVIEHVGDDARQEQFASEVRRVGKRLWVQTPALACPFEPHYLAPFVHWLPVAIRRRIVRYLTPWGWMEKLTQEEIDDVIAHTRLLSKSRMKALFPDCQILTERMFWIIPKSYIALRREEPVESAEREKSQAAILVSPLPASG